MALTPQPVPPTEPDPHQVPDQEPHDPDDIREPPRPYDRPIRDPKPNRLACWFDSR